MLSDTSVPPPFVPAPKKRDYLIPAILTTLLCCLPFGVVAIVCSVRANSAYDFGKFEEAEAHARAALRWVIAGVVGGFLGIAAYLFLVVCMAWVPTILECDGACEEEIQIECESWELPSEMVM